MKHTKINVLEVIFATAWKAYKLLYKFSSQFPTILGFSNIVVLFTTDIHKLE